MKTNSSIAVIALILLGLTAGCDSGPKSGRGFKFPEGDIGRGQAAFVRLNCYTCHQVDGVAGLPAPSVAPERVITLGGEVMRLKSYGDLVTAVIHPSVAISEKLTGEARKEATDAGRSPMPNLNQYMTVTEMLDLVTFLQPRYRHLDPLVTGPYWP